MSVRVRKETQRSAYKHSGKRDIALHASSRYPMHFRRRSLTVDFSIRLLQPFRRWLPSASTPIFTVLCARLHERTK